MANTDTQAQYSSPISYFDKLDMKEVLRPKTVDPEEFVLLMHDWQEGRRIKAPAELSRVRSVPASELWERIPGYAQVRSILRTASGNNRNDVFNLFYTDGQGLDESPTTPTRPTSFYPRAPSPGSEQILAPVHEPGLGSFDRPDQKARGSEESVPTRENSRILPAR